MLVEGINIFLKKKTKSENIAMNNTEIYQKMKNKDQLSIEEILYKGQ